MTDAELGRDDSFVVSPSVTSRQLDDELILLDLRGGEYFSLNRSGAAVWEGIARGVSLGRLDSSLADQWPVGPEDRWRMITEVVAELLVRGLVERRG